MEAVLEEIRQIISTEIPTSLEKHLQIQNRVVQATPESDKEFIHIDILRYAIYGIIQPEIRAEKTNLLLDLLTSCECIRLCNLEMLEDNFPDHMKVDDIQDDNPLFEYKETLLRLQKSSMRDIWLRIVETCCANHLWETYMKGESLVDFNILFKRYSSPSKGSHDSRSIFHSRVLGLNLEERQSIDAALAHCMSCIVEAFRMAHELADDKRSASEILRSDEFKDNFAPPDFVTKAKLLPVLIKAYVDEIQENFHIVKELVPE